MRCITSIFFNISYIVLYYIVLSLEDQGVTLNDDLKKKNIYIEGLWKYLRLFMFKKNHIFSNIPMLLIHFLYHIVE